MPFVKLDANILTSTIWSENSDVRVVWIYLLVSADSEGVVRVTVPGIAMQCKLDVAIVREALEKFASPDSDSRTAAADGRRIRIEREPEFEIHLLNYARYRQKDHTATERKRRQRERERLPKLNAGVPTPVTRDKRDVTGQSVTVTQAEAYRDKNLVAPSSPTGSSSTKVSTRGNGRRGRGNPDIPVLVKFYETEFGRILERTPVVHHGAAEKSFQTLLAGRTLDEAKTIVTDFLERPPPFYAEHSLFNPEHIVKAANVVLLRNRKANPQAISAPVSSDDLAALRRAREETGAQPGGAQ